MGKFSLTTSLSKRELIILFFCFHLVNCTLNDSSSQNDGTFGFIHGSHNLDTNEAPFNLPYKDIQITYQISTLNNLVLDSEVLLNLKNDINQQIFYFQQLLKVKENQHKNKFPINQKTCFDQNISINDKLNGISNSDLHLYIDLDGSDESQMNSQKIGICFFRDIPRFGYFKIKLIEYYQMDDLVKRTFLKMKIFEIVGFSYQFFEKWVSPQQKDLPLPSNQNQIYITSINIIKAFQAEFKCDQIDQIPIARNNNGIYEISDKLFDKDSVLLNKSQEQTMHYNELLINSALIDLGWYYVGNQNFHEPLIIDTQVQDEITNDNTQISNCSQIDDKFLLKSRRSLVVCHYSCLTCSTTQLNGCLTCPTLMNRETSTVGGQCPCKPGFTDYGVVLCSSCHYSCNGANCSGATYNQCTVTCPSNAITFRTNKIAVDFTCPCQSGYYDISLQTICGKCNSNCLTCSGTSTTCLTCNDALSLTLDKTTQLCICRTSCRPCHYSCDTCSGPLKTECLSCDQTRTLIDFNCICKAGFYDDGVNQFCGFCDTICDACSSAGQCTQCPSTATTFRVDNSSKDGTCPCDLKYVSLNGDKVCTKCHESCLTCSGATSSECLSCSDSENRVYDNTKKTCVCKAGFYQDVKLNWCNPCDDSCGSCKSKSALDCLSCSQKYFSYQNQCVLTCPAGMFTNITTGKCETCSGLCIECDSKADRCTQCPDTHTLNAVSQICSPQVQMDEFGALYFSEGCHISCFTCYKKQSFTACRTCRDSRTPQRGITAYTTECVCRAGLTDKNLQQCSQSNEQDSLVDMQIGITTSSIVISFICALFTGSPIQSLSLFDNLHTVSFLRFVQVQKPYGFDQVQQPTSYSQASTLFHLPSSGIDQVNRVIKLQKRRLAQNQEKFRFLQTNLTQNTSNIQSVGNEKISLGDQYPYFLANMGILLMIHLIVWSLGLFANYKLKLTDEEQKNEKSWKYSIRNFLWLTLPLITFVYTTSEGWLLAFYSFYFSNTDTSLEIASIVFLAFYIFYFTVFFLMLLRNLNIIPKQNTPQHDTYLRNYSYVINFFKPKAITRNFPVILILRQILTSYLLVFHYDTQEIQVLLIMISYFMFWFYVIGSQPFILTRNNIFAIIIQTQVCVVLIFFYLAIKEKEGSIDNVDYFKKTIYMIFILLLTQILFTLINLVFAIIEYLRQQRQDQQVVPFDNVSSAQDSENNSPQKSNQISASPDNQFDDLSSMTTGNNLYMNGKNKDAPRKLEEIEAYDNHNEHNLGFQALSKPKDNYKPAPDQKLNEDGNEGISDLGDKKKRNINQIYSGSAANRLKVQNGNGVNSNNRSDLSETDIDSSIIKENESNKNNRNTSGNLDESEKDQDYSSSPNMKNKSQFAPSSNSRDLQGSYPLIQISKPDSQNQDKDNLATEAINNSQQRSNSELAVSQVDDDGNNQDDENDPDNIQYQQGDFIYFDPQKANLDIVQPQNQKWQYWSKKQL